MASEHLGVETINYTEVDSVVETLKEMTGAAGPTRSSRPSGRKATAQGWNTRTTG
jgi:hypothetical protein